jgi:hypothetical protein
MAPLAYMLTFFSLVAWANRGNDSVAVCITGMPRNLLGTLVSGSINRHVIGALLAEGARLDVFVLLSVEASNATLRDEIRALAPRRLRSVTHVSFVSPTMLPLPRCSEPLLPGGLQHNLKVLQQFRAVERCYERIQRREKYRGERYSWILRLRSDMIFFRSISLAVLDASAVYVPLGGMSKMPYAQCQNDHMFVCPRLLCRPYFKVLELFHSSMSRCQAERHPLAREHVPDGLLGPPTAPFALPAQEQVPGKPPRTAQWWVAARYGAQPLCRQPEAYRLAGEQAPYCGTIREFPWKYSISRPGGTADIHSRCAHLSCIRLTSDGWPPRAAQLYLKQERADLTKECKALEKQECSPGPTKTKIWRRVRLRHS